MLKVFPPCYCRPVEGLESLEMPFTGYVHVEEALALEAVEFTCPSWLNCPLFIIHVQPWCKPERWYVMSAVMTSEVIQELADTNSYSLLESDPS